MPLNTEPLRLIWVTPKFPIGTLDGAQQATRSLLNHLTRLGVGIDLVCLLPAGDTADPAAARQELNLLSCSIISRNRSWLGRLPGWNTPFTFRTFTAPP